MNNLTPKQLSEYSEQLTKATYLSVEIPSNIIAQLAEMNDDYSSDIYEYYCDDGSVFTVDVWTDELGNVKLFVENC